MTINLWPLTNQNQESSCIINNISYYLMNERGEDITSLAIRIKDKYTMNKLRPKLCCRVYSTKTQDPFQPSYKKHTIVLSQSLHTGSGSTGSGH